MGVHESSKGRSNVPKKMTRDRTGSDYSENMSDATTCSCMTNSVEKCSLRSCGMFQEPFFLHPPGSRPRDGIYINPMSAYIGEPIKSKESESFYLHSPHELVYTRITHLFAEVEKPRNGVANAAVATVTSAPPAPTPTTPPPPPPRAPTPPPPPPPLDRHSERKDETLTVKVDVHINNGGLAKGTGGNASSDISRDGSEHAYEQICIRQEETTSVGSYTHKRITDNVSDSSRSRKTGRRYSRSSSGSECSNMSSEIHCFTSSTSTPSPSRNSSNERNDKSQKIHGDLRHEKRETTQVKSEKESRPLAIGPSLLKPPPPPPPPPPDHEETIVLLVNPKQPDEKKDGSECSQDGRSESSNASSAANKFDVSCGENQQPEVPSTSLSVDVEEIKTTVTTSQASHLVNKHMVLPFIPPKFANTADSDTLLKPSEYLKSICKLPSKKNSLSKARSVDNLDIQGRDSNGAEEEGESKLQEQHDSPPGPPPPPLSPLQKPRNASATAASAASAASSEGEAAKNIQPLATISIQDLTSIQLRRTNTKMNATKTFSAPPPRSVSMTNVSEPFHVQKIDLIAELKRTKDIPGIKKLKVERAQVEKTQEQNLKSEISKTFSVSNFVDQIPEKDSSGNVIPIWKRQMLARKAAERAKKELEEQIARENEEKRQKAIPPWKRQLLAKKDNEEKRINSTAPPIVPSVPAVKVEITSPKRDVSPVCNNAKEEMGDTDLLDRKAINTNNATVVNNNNISNKKSSEREEDSDDGQIIPWRAQLRKTNSKLNILD